MSTKGAIQNCANGAAKIFSRQDRLADAILQAMCRTAIQLCSAGCLAISIVSRSADSGGRQGSLPKTRTVLRVIVIALASLLLLTFILRFSTTLLD